jgi:cytochrome c oxidase assembly protein subunit 11
VNEHQASDRQANDNRRTFTRLSIVAVFMFGFGYALVPFYDRICMALGINSLVERSEPAANTRVDRTRTVSIEFDANAHNMPWHFQPMVKHMAVHPGQLVHVEYEVANVRSAPVTGQAVVSYGPRAAGEYVRKLECFCFSQQTLAAGETRRMPVTFVLDASLPAEINTVTLSYTFFERTGADVKAQGKT